MGSFNQRSGRFGVAIAVVILTSAQVTCGARRGPRASPSEGQVAEAQKASPSAARAGATALPDVKFKPYAVVDAEQQGLSVGAFRIPTDWTGTSKVTWDYSSGNVPARVSARLSAGDGSAWIETFPTELFYWVQPVYQRVALGARSFGQIHYPGINVQIALKTYVIARYRGNVDGLKIVGFRPIPNLARLLGKPAIDGDSLAARIRYRMGGHVVDEELFCLLGKDQPVASHSPVGTAYEHHRVLAYVHSMGAWDGKLEALHPLLGYVVASYQQNQAWSDNLARIQREIGARFNRQLARGYQQIAAAGALSRQISANNDAFLARIDAQRVASHQASAAQRAANAEASSNDQSNDAFDQYIRGTEKMQDPYWGTSERSYNEQYHWTDGHGSYQDSNDPTFDPNQHSNVNWQRMEPAK